MQKKIDGDKIVITILILIILLAATFVLFSIFSSSKYFYNNEPQKEENKVNENANTHEISSTPPPSTVSEDEKDKLNVDKEKIEETKKDNTPLKETEIAAFTTSIYDKDQNRIYNISKAIGILNGSVIENASEFSFNNTIGPMGEAAGYKQATGFDSNGNKIKSFGGGMCQISSTLYNSALIANLQITERHPHSRRVYYVPKDKDATIYYGSLDLKFINNTGKKIRIDASSDNVNVTIKLISIEK